MKQVHATYSFVASTKTITLTGLNIDQDQLLLIVNATRGVQYFNFADSSLRATVTPGTNTTVVLTDASTTGHANGDALVIYYDDQVTSQVVSGTVTANPGTGAFTVSGTVGLDNASLVALENITVTVGSSVALAAGSAQVGSVTISNFPSTQTIAGTVTANVPALSIDTGLGGSVLYPVSGLDVNAVRAVLYSGYDFSSDQGAPVDGTNPLHVQGTVGVQGTVTANIERLIAGAENFISIAGEGSGGAGVMVGFRNSAGETSIVGVTEESGAGPLPISGTVTVSSLPASTVTVSALPSGALTTRFGSVTTANTAQITSAVTNTNRKYLLAQNISAGTVTIGIGFSPTTTQGIQLTAGGGLTFDAFCPTGAVYWLGAVTGANYCLIEG